MKIQALKQSRSLESMDAPISSSQVEGGYSGIPKMHPLKSSNPVFKATGLIHGLRMRAPRLKMPHLSGIKFPHI